MSIADMDDRIAKGGARGIIRRSVGRAPGPEDDAPRKRAAGVVRFPIVTARELLAMPPQTWLVKNVLPSRGLAAIYGPSGSGKSFLVLDVVASAAEGREWFGHRTRQARCVYLGLEGQSGVPKRVRAWEVENGRAFPEGVRFMLSAFRLGDPLDVDGLAEAVEAVGGADVVVVDTLNRAAPLADENSSADMGGLLEGSRVLAEVLSCLVVLVAHTGKNTERGVRGHSSLFAALDAAIEVSRQGERREWRSGKEKDERDGDEHPFRLRRVAVGQDEDGDEIASCVVASLTATEEAAEEPEAPPLNLPAGGNQRIVLDALGPLLRVSNTRGAGGAPATRPCVAMEDVIEGTRGKVAVDPKRHRERVQQALNGLIGRGVLGSGEGWVWRR